MCDGIAVAARLHLHSLQGQLSFDRKHAEELPRELMKDGSFGSGVAAPSTTDKKQAKGKAGGVAAAGAGKKGGKGVGAANKRGGADDNLLSEYSRLAGLTKGDDDDANEEITEVFCPLIAL